MYAWGRILLNDIIGLKPSTKTYTALLKLPCHSAPDQTRPMPANSGPASALSCVHYLGGHPWRSGPPQSSVCCLRPPGLSAPPLWTHTGWPVERPLTLTQLNHVNHAICSPSTPYGIHRGEFIPSESQCKKKKRNVNVGGVFRPTFCLRASLRCRSVSTGEGREKRCFGFTFNAFTLPVCCGGTKAVHCWRDTRNMSGCCSYSE